MIKSCSNLIKIINKLFNDRNVELQKMAIWSEKNNISLNLTKTIHFFTRKRKKCHIKIDLPILYINNFEIVRESRTKFLGIYMDKNLTWKYDIEHICNKISKNVGIMCKSRNSLGCQQYNLSLLFLENQSLGNYMEALFYVDIVNIVFVSLFFSSKVLLWLLCQLEM